MILFATFAVTKYFSMETVFDHNITDDEWKWLSGSMDKEFYLSHVDVDTAIADIASLFYKRGQKDQAMTISEKLPPDVYNDLWRLLTHP